MAPDFARTVDIHRKPSYDPVELFLDPAIPFPRLKFTRNQYSMTEISFLIERTLQLMLGSGHLYNSASLHTVNDIHRLEHG